MASLAFGVAGAALGAQVGTVSILGLTFSGASIGFALGSSIGNLLFPAGGGSSSTILPPASGPRLGDLRQQTSSFGAPIPKGYGTWRIAGNVIWQGPIQERKTVTVQQATTTSEGGGGKGGGGSSTTSTTSQTVTSFTYDVSFALALTEGPIAGVRRIWADSQLIYNVGEGASVATVLASKKLATSVNLHLGSETQVPDPIIESHQGSGAVPGHRGLAYIVFSEFQLQTFGNRIPLLEVEVFQTGTATNSLTQTASVFSSSIFDTSLTSGFPGPIHSGYVEPDGSVRLYMYAQKSAANDFDIYKWTVPPGAAPSTFTLTQHQFASLPADPVFNPGVHLSGALSGFTHDMFLVPLAAPGTNPYFIDTFWNADPDAELWLDLEEGKAVILSHPGAGATVLVRSCKCGRYLYTFWIADIAVPGTTTEGVYVYDFADSQDGDYLAGTLLVDIADATDPIINCDATGWFFNNEGTGDTYEGLWWFPHNSGTPEGNYNNTVGRVPFRVDVANDLFRGVGLTADLHYMTSAEGRASVDADMVENRRGLTQMPAFGDSGVVFTAVTASLTLDTTQEYRWGVFTTGAPAATTLKAITDDLMEEVGLVNGTDFDNTALGSTSVEGFIRTRPMPVRNALEPLTAAYAFDVVESGGKLIARLQGGAPTATLTVDEIGARPVGEDIESDLVATRMEESTLPRRISVLFYNKDFSYQQGEQYAARLITNTVNQMQVELPIVLTTTQARQVAEKLLYIAWAERERLTFTGTVAALDIEPGDVVTVQANNRTQQVRVLAATFNVPNLVEFEAVRDDTGVFVSVATGVDTEITDQVDIAVAGATELVPLDAPLLRNSHNFSGIYVAATGFDTSWRGTSVFLRNQAGTDWSAEAVMLNESVIARATTILATTDPTRYDRTNTVTIEPINADFAPSSITYSELLFGGNTALIGASGRWEVIRFQTVVDNGDGTYTLSFMMRGRAGTEHLVGTHQASDQFILMTDAAADRISLSIGDLGLTKTLRGVSIGKLLHETPDTSVVFNAVSEIPYSPVQITGARDGSNNLTITWVRRSRLTPRILFEPPLAETTESYSIDVLDAPGGNVLRTITASTPTASYTAAEQTTDGLTPGNPVDVEVFQISASVGRGTAGVAVV